MDDRSTRHSTPTPRRHAARPTPHAPAPRTHAHSTGHARSPRNVELTFGLVAAAAVAAAVAVGLLLWANRDVSVTVNGTRSDVHVNATLDDIFSSRGITVNPGDLVSVGGNLLTEGEGAPFSAEVDGARLDAQQIEDFRAQGGETIVFGDGDDLTEPSTKEERDVQPKLEPYEKIGAITFVAQWPRAGKQVFLTGEISGETVEAESDQPVQNAVIQSVNPTPDDGSKVIALTFDDGPSSYTQRYLDILSEYDAHATFFCLGGAAAANPDLVRAIEDQGSQVVSHTQSHKQLTKLNATELQTEVRDAFSAIEAGGASPTTVIRPPYGDFTNDTWLASGGVLSVSAIWNLDSEDWRLPGADAIVANCTNGAYPGAIVLMHDGGGNRDQDLEALPRILETLRDQGYSFVTLSELMAKDGRIPADVAAGNATMPEGCVWPTEMA